MRRSSPFADAAPDLIRGLTANQEVPGQARDRVALPGRGRAC